MLKLCLLLALFAICAHAWNDIAMKDKVDRLPDQPDVDFEIFSGYIPIRNETRSLFYMMHTSSNDPLNDSTVFTFSGGPGCSSSFFNFGETGAFTVDANNKLHLRPTRTNKIANVVFVDSPAGVGFSKGSSREWTHKEVAEDVGEFIVRFLDRFNELKKNRVILQSESMGGSYLPAFAREIAVNYSNEINFYGFLVGNPLVHMPLRDTGFFLTYGYREAFDYRDFQKYKELCVPKDDVRPYPQSVDSYACSKLESGFRSAMRGRDNYAIDHDVCVSDNRLQFKSGSMGEFIAKAFSKGKVDTSSILQDSLDEIRSNAAFRHLFKNKYADIKNIDWTGEYEPCYERFMTNYLNRADVQAALRVQPQRWSTCTSVNYSNRDMDASNMPVYEFLLDNTNVKMLIYSGTDDAMCSTTELKMAFYNYDAFQTVGEWTPWKYDGVRIGGYKQTFASKKSGRTMNIITVIGAGHMVPTTHPAESQELYNKYMRGEF